MFAHRLQRLVRMVNTKPPAQMPQALIFRDLILLERAAKVWNPEAWAEAVQDLECGRERTFAGFCLKCDGKHAVNSLFCEQCEAKLDAAGESEEA